MIRFDYVSVSFELLMFANNTFGAVTEAYKHGHQCDRLGVPDIG